MDEEVLSALAYFQEEIEELSQRFQNLKDITYDLYRENEELQQENADLKRLLFQQQEDENNVSLPEEKRAYSNLARLYQENYHICHLSFGEKRQGDCLFCLQLLENQMEEGRAI
ncbi:MAG: initiation-control protein YabA [Bacillota bacterium]